MCYEGAPYCEEHYRERLEGEFAAEFSAWPEGGAPSERFKYLLGRISHEFGWLMHGSYLTPAMIRGRAYSFVKTATGCVFQITRHPGAFGLGYTGKRVVQTWRADLPSETLLLVDDRPWQDGDIDPRGG